MREIVFDTETTGLSFVGGDRLVEIGCVELINRVETGRVFHRYVNPERAMPAEAQAIHGLGDAFLSDKPVFTAIVEEFLEFVGDAPLIAHNAGFDFSFVNGELTKAGRVVIARERMVDTLMLARTRHPGSKHTLDALCVRYGIDRSHRVLHGALLDAQLLSQVYVELTGGRQIGLGLAVETTTVVAAEVITVRGEIRPPRPHAASPEELAAHAEFLRGIKEPLWGAAAFG